MPSKSKAQADFMRAIAKSPSFAKKVNVGQSVGKDFLEADTGKRHRSSTRAKANRQKTNHGPNGMPNYSLKKFAGLTEGGNVKKSKKKYQMGGMANAGGATRGLDRAAAMSGRATPATGRPMKKGGGIEVRGKTRGKFI